MCSTGEHFAKLPVEKQKFVTEVDDLLRGYKVTLSNSKVFPFAQNVVHDINISDSQKPIYRRDYPKSPEVLKFLEKQVMNWLDTGW